MKTYLFDYRLHTENEEEIFTYRLSYFEKRSSEIRNYILSSFPRSKEIVENGGIFLIASDNSIDDLGVKITNAFVFSDKDFWVLIETNLQNGITSTDIIGSS